VIHAVINRAGRPVHDYCAEPDETRREMVFPTRCGRCRRRLTDTPGVPRPRIEALPGHRYRLIEEWHYVWYLDDGKRRELIIEKGFVFDASVPRIAWGLIDPRDLEDGGVPHDLVYYYAEQPLPEGTYLVDGEPELEPWTRQQADRLFGRVLREWTFFEGEVRPPVKRWKRRVAYRMVRLAGWRAWQRNAAARREELAEAAE
jgi:hypothetical protein